MSENDTYHARWIEAQQRIERLESVLRQIEWSGCDFYPDVGPNGSVLPGMCPLCDQTPKRGHSPDCLVGMVLEPKP